MLDLETLNERESNFLLQSVGPAISAQCLLSTRGLPS